MAIDLNLARQVSTLEAEVANLRDWQEHQGAALERLEVKLGQILMWLLGLMGGVATSLILLVLNLSAGRF